MIATFEEYTQAMADSDILLARRIAMIIESSDGWLTSNKIAEAVGDGLEGPRLRKIIHYIRKEGIVPGLIASSKGYRRSYDVDDIDRYIDSLRQRSRAIESVAAYLERDRDELSEMEAMEAGR